MADVSQPSPLTPALQRAQALIASGDLGGALVLLERAVELGRENLGEDHGDVLAAQQQLAGVLLQVDEPVQARRTLEEAYAAGHFRLGDSDPLMLRISHDLGVVAEELGNRHEARKAFGRVAQHGPAALGEHHPLVTRAQAHLGQDHNPAEVRETAPAPAQPFPSAPLLDRPAPPRPITDVPLPDPRDAPTTALPAIPGLADPAPQPAAGAWTTPPRQPAPPPHPAAPEAAVPTGNPWTATPPPAPPPSSDIPPPPHAWTTGSHPHETPTPPWSAEDVAPHHDTSHRNVTIWRGDPAPHPAQPNAVQLAATAYPLTPHHPPHPAPDSPRRRGLAIFAVIAATLSAVVAVAALVFVLADRVNTPGAQPTVPSGETDVPTPDDVPPGDITLEDQGSAVDLRWSDPAAGQVPFMVTMARPGETLRPVSSVGPGETSFRMGGLNRRLDYCFAVVAVYDTDRFASSDQVCTERR